MENFFREINYYINGIQWMVVVQKYFHLFSTPGLWQLLLCFFASAILMITRLNAIEKNGFEGTLVGTLVMPYFSGFPNLCFAYFLIQNPKGGSLVLENCLVNNLTNLTLILGIPAAIWGLKIYAGPEKNSPTKKIDHLSLLLSILALVFFSLAVWLVGKDHTISRSDGFLLIGLFFFWQLYHVFDVLKNVTRTERKIKKRIFIDLVIIGFCAWGIFSSTEYLIHWIEINGKGFFAKENMGFLSGVLMVMPNAFLAFWYAAVKKSEIAYSSQIGDCHICIPLCIGLFAVFNAIRVGSGFETGLFILIGACGAHFFFSAVFGRLPRLAGLLLIGIYGWFLYGKVI